MKIIRFFKGFFSFNGEEDFVVVDLTTKMIQSMNSRDWGKLRNKKNYMVIK